MEKQKGKKLTVLVRTIKGMSFKMALKPDDTVMDTKGKLEKMEGTPVSDQVLLYAGKVLDDQSTMESYHFRDGVTLDMEPPTVAIVLVGNVGVGKTSILSNFVNPLSKLPQAGRRNATWANGASGGVRRSSSMPPSPASPARVEMQPTLSCTYKSFETMRRDMQLKLYKDEPDIPEAITAVDAVGIVYSVTDAQSFESIPAWWEIVHKFAAEGTNVTLIGNKSDADDDRKVGALTLFSRA